MNFVRVNKKSIAVIAAALSATGLSYARIDVMMNVPRKIVPCSEPLTSTVQVHNTGTRAAAIDVMIEWPVAEFECSTVTRVAGEIERTEEGVRWHGFSLKPGERMALGIRSMNMNERSTKRLTARATKTTARKTQAKPQELDIFMLDDECCDAAKVGPADPKADFVNVVAGGSIIINVLANDGCDDPNSATLTILTSPDGPEPQYGTATVVGAAPQNILYTQSLPVPALLPATDVFNYEVCCTGSPESCSEVSVYVTIVDPTSFLGSILQGCSTPIPLT